MSISTDLKAPTIEKSVIVSKKVKMIMGTCIIVVSDFLILCLSLLLAFWTRAEVLPCFIKFNNIVQVNSLWNLWWLPFLCVMILAYKGFYRRRFPYWHEVRLMITVITTTFTMAIIFLFLMKITDTISRSILIMTYMYSLFLLPANRYFVKNRLIAGGWWTKPVLILGAGKTAELVIKGFGREKTMGYSPVGMLDDDSKKKGIISGMQYIPILGRFSDVQDVMNRTGIKDIVVAIPGMKNGRLVELTNSLQRLSANILLAPDLFGIPLAGMKIDFLFDEQVLLMGMPNNLASKWNKFLKRSFDIFVGGIILFASLPVMLLIIIAIKLDSKGEVIYYHPCIGKNGSSFKCLKFRTMIINAQEALENLLACNLEIRQEWEKDFKLKNDPRITRVGKFLRKTSLDELPQLFNVMAGQMSLVGPRPIIADEIEKYGNYYEDYKKVTPGITGPWQVSGRNDIDYMDRVTLVVLYIRNWSVWMDVIIMIKTIGVVFNRKGAY